jgi:hypothetical protein
LITLARVVLVSCAVVMVQVVLVAVEQRPPQPWNFAPESAVAVTVTAEVPGTPAVQSLVAPTVGPQVIPSIVDDPAITILPGPLTSPVSVTLYFDPNVAETTLAAFMATVQVVAVDDLQPLQLSTFEAVFGVAVTITSVLYAASPVQFPEVADPVLQSAMAGVVGAASVPPYAGVNVAVGTG